MCIPFLNLCIYSALKFYLAFTGFCFVAGKTNDRHVTLGMICVFGLNVGKVTVDIFWYNLIGNYIWNHWGFCVNISCCIPKTLYTSTVKKKIQTSVVNIQSVNLKFNGTWCLAHSLWMRMGEFLSNELSRIAKHKNGCFS